MLIATRNGMVKMPTLSHYDYARFGLQFQHFLRSIFTGLRRASAATQNDFVRPAPTTKARAEWLIRTRNELVTMPTSWRRRLGPFGVSILVVFARCSLGLHQARITT